MLDILAGTTRTCDGIRRRDLVRVGALGLVGGLGLADLFRLRARGEAAGPCRSVIQVVLGGGPSHLDTYDPKPDAPREYRGPFAAIRTALPGVLLSELMPQQARVLDRMALIRDLAHDTADHAAGLHQILTGFAPTEARPAGNERPSVGSVVAQVRGASRPGVPAYAAMTEGSASAGLFVGRSYLPAASEPLALQGDPSGPAGVAVPDLDPPPGLTLRRLDDRRDLLARLDRLERARDRSGRMDELDQHAAQAYAVVSGSATRRALDLGSEPAATRDRYGRTRIGQSCLLARRLVEAGVGFVTVSSGDWDHHIDVATGCRSQAPPLDRAVAALVSDLAGRGLDREVLVLVWGEFGRTPRVNGAGGRDHWPTGMSAILAGGGLAMGQVVGATTPRGDRPTDAPRRPADVIATVYHALGIDATRTFRDEGGRPRTILDRGTPIAPLVGGELNR